ncbi:hypothetical protein C8J57DRAFT_1252496 [Mycena rebaudengoi]|nr:hypothetical protein C8J57DRAFT_1252496 [Mycena rebaudengoi]
MVHSWAPVKPILCTPAYYPSLQHNHSIDAHSADPEGTFYGVTIGRVCSVYSTLEDAQKTIKGFEGGVFFIVDDWTNVTRHWADFCVANHCHSPLSSPDSSPLSSPSFSRLSAASSAFTVSQPSTPEVAVSGAAPVYTLHAVSPLDLPNDPQQPSSASHRSSKKKAAASQSIQSLPTKALSLLPPLKQTDLPLAPSLESTPLPPPFTSKPQPPSTSYRVWMIITNEAAVSHADTRALYGEHTPVLTCTRLDAELSPTSPPTHVALGAAPVSPPLVYAKNNSKMLSTQSAAKLQAFMTLAQIPGAPPVLYTVSGHPIAFRNLNPVFRVLQATPLGEMLFTNSSSQLKEFMEPPTTHASRNPSKQVQEKRGHKKGLLTDSQKATRTAATLKRKVAKEALNDNLNKFYALRNKSIWDMAAAHDREPEYIKRLIMSKSQYKTTRPMTMRNVLMHDFSVEAKTGTNNCTAGQSLSLRELHALADITLLETRSPEEEEHLWAQLSAHRELSHVGLCGSNAAAAADTHFLLTFVQEELACLFERTGTWCGASTCTVSAPANTTTRLQHPDSPPTLTMPCIPHIYTFRTPFSHLASRTAHLQRHLADGSALIQNRIDRRSAQHFQHAHADISHTFHPFSASGRRIRTDFGRIRKVAVRLASRPNNFWA